MAKDKISNVANWLLSNHDPMITAEMALRNFGVDTSHFRCLMSPDNSCFNEFKLDPIFTDYSHLLWLDENQEFRVLLVLLYREIFNHEH